MKTNILVATDLTPIGQNAVAYAAALSRRLEAELTVVHAFHFPLPTDESTVYADRTDIDAATAETTQRAERLLKLIPALERYRYRLRVAFGYPSDIIDQIARQQRTDLVVMGAGRLDLTERVLGSVTTSVIRSATYPVLAVPGNATFHPIEKVLFACDFERIRTSGALGALKGLLRQLNAETDVLYVSEDLRSVSREKVAEGIDLETHLEGVPHDYSYTFSNDPAIGIVQYAEDQRIDLIAMIPRARTFWESVFRGSVTRDVLFRSRKPLLAVPG